MLPAGFPAHRIDFQRDREDYDVYQRMRKPADILLAQPVHEECILAVIFTEVGSAEEAIF